MVTEALKASHEQAGQQEQAEAKVPRQQPSEELKEVKHGGVQERIRMETSNVISLNSNRETALARTAHFQVVQEACLNETQTAVMKTATNLRGKLHRWTHGSGAGQGIGRSGSPLPQRHRRLRSHDSD